MTNPLTRKDVLCDSLSDSEAQMVVEVAVIAPVMIVVALIIFNLACFLEAVARFDRIVPDIVMSVAVSPSSTTGSQAHRVKETLEEAMSDIRGVSVSVEAQTLLDDLAAGLGFTMAPNLTRYVCTLSYEPWPSGFSVAGIDAGIPVHLSHEKTFVVDRYRTGVVF